MRTKNNLIWLRKNFPGLIVAILIIGIWVYLESQTDKDFIEESLVSNVVIIKTYKYRDRSLVPAHRVAMSHVKKKEHVQAKEAFERIIMSSPNEPNAHYGLGMAQLHLKEIDAAEQSFNTVLTLAPNTAPAYFGLGHVANWRDDNEKSIQYYLKSLSIRPNFSSAHSSIANRYREINNLELALKHYKKVVKLVPNTNLARKSLKKITAIERQRQSDADIELEYK